MTAPAQKITATYDALEVGDHFIAPDGKGVGPVTLLKRKEQGARHMVEVYTKSGLTVYAEIRSPVVIMRPNESPSQTA